MDIMLPAFVLGRGDVADASMADFILFLRSRVKFQRFCAACWTEAPGGGALGKP